MENPTKAITATLRMIIAIAATSMVESRLAMRHFGGRRAAALIWIMRPTLTNRRTARYVRAVYAPQREDMRPVNELRIRPR